MAQTMTERIDWHFLGTRLRAIDFHFLWMVASPEAEWLWTYVGIDGGDVLFATDASREDFAAAAHFIDQPKRANARRCDMDHVRSQARRVGQIFASAGKHVAVTRHASKGRCDTTIRLPLKGAFK